MSRRALALALSLALAACGGEERAELGFEPAPEHGGEGVVTVPDLPAAQARLALLGRLNAAPDNPSLAGEGAWETVALVRPGETKADALSAGRTFVRRGSSDLRLDFRLAAGDRGGFAGAVVPMGAERAMVQLRLSDQDTLEAKFRVHIVADDGPGGAHPREITPRYLAQGLPRGRYRAWVDVLPRGARFLVGVTVQDGQGETRAHGWASPIEVQRPWLR